MTDIPCPVCRAEPAGEDKEGYLTLCATCDAIVHPVDWWGNANLNFENVLAAVYRLGGSIIVEVPREGRKNWTKDPSGGKAFGAAIVEAGCGHNSPGRGRAISDIAAGIKEAIRCKIEQQATGQTHRRACKLTVWIEPPCSVRWDVS